MPIKIVFFEGKLLHLAHSTNSVWAIAIAKVAFSLFVFSAVDNNNK